MARWNGSGDLPAMPHQTIFGCYDELNLAPLRGRRAWLDVFPGVKTPG
jgi:hypothetical protein